MQHTEFIPVIAFSKEEIELVKQIDEESYNFARDLRKQLIVCNF